MKVLVTGGMGYLGSIVVRKLVEEGFKVKILDSLMYGNSLYRSESNFELIQGDIRDIKVLLNAIADADVVIHLAGIVGDSAGNLDKELTVNVNYLATKQLAKLCSERDLQLIFSSTCSIYGTQLGGLLNEKSKTCPLSIYAITKLAAEKAIKEISNNYVIFRLGTLFGLSPRMRFDLVVNKFIAQAIQDKKIIVFGGSQYRPFIHIRDVADFFVKVINTNKVGVYNLGGTNYRINSVAKIIQQRTGCEVSFFEDLKDPRSYAVDSSLAERTFGIKFIRGIEFAVDEIKDAYEKGVIKDYKEPILSNEECLRGLLKRRSL
jgi:nucleoside-diphosphate-sugar epimerase